MEIEVPLNWDRIYQLTWRNFNPITLLKSNTGNSEMVNKCALYANFA